MMIEEIRNKELMVNIDIHGEIDKATTELGGRVIIPDPDLKTKLSKV
ncbi:MAG: hypothetical protein ACP5TI_03365 [Thermoprotei archaeon]